MRARTSPMRTIGHAIWVGPVVAVAGAVVVFTADPHLRPAPDDDFPVAVIVALSALAFSRAWVAPVVAVSVVVGSAVAAVREVAARARAAFHGRAARLGLPLAAALVVLAGIAAGAVLGGRPARDPWVVLALAGWAVVTGAVSWGLGGRRSARGDEPPTPLGRRAAWWWLAAIESAAVAWTGAVVVWVTTVTHHTAASCASLLGVPAGQAVVESSTFPPQQWCVSADRAHPLLPTWPLPAVVTGFTVAALCALMACYWSELAAATVRTHRVRLGAGIVGALILVAGASGVAWASNPRPTADVAAAARSRIPSPAPTAAPPAPTRTPTPRATPTPTIDGITADLKRMSTIARDTGGPDLTWTRPLAVVAEGCTDEAGRTGNRVTLTGRFTTGDLVHPQDNLEFLSVTQENETVAKAIVDAWTAAGLTGEPWPLHGEWWAGSPGAGLYEAHMGFEGGAGDITVTGACVNRR